MLCSVVYHCCLNSAPLIPLWEIHTHKSATKLSAAQPSAAKLSAAQLSAAKLSAAQPSPVDLKPDMSELWTYMCLMTYDLCHSEWPLPLLTETIPSITVLSVRLQFNIAKVFQFTRHGDVHKQSSLVFRFFLIQYFFFFDVHILLKYQYFSSLMFGSCKISIFFFVDAQIF